jgi:hypothetical protein
MVMKEIERQTPKQQFLAQFEENFKKDFLPKTWGAEKRAIVAAETSPGKIKSLMFTSIPMVCKASECMFAQTCPLQTAGNAPEGYPCPYESAIVKNHMADYMEQLDVDVDNLVELSMIRDLVDQEVQYFRKTQALAKDDFIQSFVVGVDSNGDPVISTRLHLAVDYEDKIHKRRSVLFKALLASRESKAKVGLGALDTVQSMSNLVMAAHERVAQRERELKQKLGIVEEDDYIDADVIEDDDD